MTTDLPQVDIRPIVAIHRGPDGFIPFTTKSEVGDWRNLFSIRADELAEWIPRIRDHLLRDAYFGVNAFYRGGHSKSQVMPMLPGVYRDREGLRYLNAAFTDLDGYNAGLSDGELVGNVLNLQDAGDIPPVSIFGLSGRGVWLYWLIHDHQEPGLPAKAFPEKLVLYCDIQRAIAARLAHLAPDALDAVRVCRVPGSINRKCGRRARYLIAADGNGKGFAYSLVELADHFGVQPKTFHPTVAAALTDPQRAARQSGWTALQQKRLRLFITLRGLRGGFKQGARNRAAMLYALFLRENSTDQATIEDEVARLSQECAPPLRPSAIRDAMKSGSRREDPYRVTDQTIANWLKITPAESRILDSTDPKGKGWPAASWWQRSAHELPEHSTRQDRQDARRKFIVQQVAKLGRGSQAVPSIRVMQGYLDEVDLHASTGTIHADYVALGIGRRRPKDNQRLLDGIAV